MSASVGCCGWDTSRARLCRVSRRGKAWSRGVSRFVGGRLARRGRSALYEYESAREGTTLYYSLDRMGRAARGRAAQRSAGKRRAGQRQRQWDLGLGNGVGTGNKA